MVVVCEEVFSQKSVLMQLLHGSQRDVVFGASFVQVRLLRVDLADQEAVGLTREVKDAVEKFHSVFGPFAHHVVQSEGEEVVAAL